MHPEVPQLEAHLRRWLAAPAAREPCWVVGEHGTGKTATIRRVLEEQTTFRWDRWSAADPGFLDTLRARLQTPRRSVQSFFQVMKPELLWIDDLEASVHPWRHICQLVRDTWTKFAAEGTPLLLSGAAVSHPILENVPLARFEFTKPEEPSILQRVSQLLHRSFDNKPPALDADTLQVYHGHRIFVPLLVLEAVHLSFGRQGCQYEKAVEALYLSDHIDALWRQCSNDELLRLHAWLSVTLPRFYLQNVPAPSEPRFTPYPGRCTARNSLRKHWLEVVLSSKDPTLRGAALDERLVTVWAEIKTRGVKKVDTVWKRTNLTAILTNTGSRTRKKNTATKVEAEPEEQVALEMTERVSNQNCPDP